MAGLKLYLDRIRKRVGYHNEALSALMAKVVAFNDEKLHRAVFRIKSEEFRKQNEKIKEGKRFVLPDLSDVLPKRSAFAKKSVIRGRIMADDFRDAITKDLRETLNKFEDTGKMPWVRRRGEKAGQLNAELVDDFRRRIIETFQGYTKRDPKYGGIPSNIRNIAVTEVASTVSQVKKEYHDKFMHVNRDVRAMKTWLHSKDHKRIKVFRKGHLEVDGRTIDADEPFVVKVYVRTKRGWRFTGQIDRMDRPHDPGAPLNQIVGCLCSHVYVYRRAE